MKINSDKVSEKYRKYIIKLVLHKRKAQYILWGTDISNEDSDYLLLNSDNFIMSFTKIQDLINYLKSNESPIDPLNTKDWVNNYKINKSYASYDLFKIKSELLNEDFSLKKLDKDTAFDLVNFYNLFSDYAYQIRDNHLLKIMKEKNTKILFDYVYESFFWDKEGREKEIALKASQFNSTIFLNNYLKMISLFENKLLMM